MVTYMVSLNINPV